MKNNEYICLNEYEYKISSYVDNYFKNLAKDKFKSKEVYFPSLISEQVLIKCNYISSFPQQLTIASYIDETVPLKEGKIKNSRMYFTPSACLHIYPMLEGKTLSNCSFTTKAQVYRHENQNFNGNTRLWNFSVREIVFIGEEQYVKNSLKNFESHILNFSKKHFLETDLVSASDHFYPTKENLIKQKMQLSNSLKKELICKIDGKETALASLNYHGFHFSKPFNFDSNSSIVSGCIGFGLERWVAALKEKNNERINNEYGKANKNNKRHF